MLRRHDIVGHRQYDRDITPPCLFHRTISMLPSPRFRFRLFRAPVCRYAIDIAIIFRVLPCFYDIDMSPLIRHDITLLTSMLLRCPCYGL